MRSWDKFFFANNKKLVYDIVNKSFTSVNKHISTLHNLCFVHFKPITEGRYISDEIHFLTF